MSAQMDVFVTAGIEGIEVVQGKPNVLSPLIHTFPTEWFPGHVMSGICYQPDSPNIHVTGIVFVPRTSCSNWMSQAFSTNPLAPNDVLYSPWKPKVKECKGFCTVFHIPPYTLKNSGQQSKTIQQKHFIQDFNTEDGGCLFFCLEHVFLTAWGYEDVTYLPGRMLLFTGDQLHSVSPYKNPISSDRRIVLQGHGIFQNNQWWLFG